MRNIQLLESIVPLFLLHLNITTVLTFLLSSFSLQCKITSLQFVIKFRFVSRRIKFRILVHYQMITCTVCSLHLQSTFILQVLLNIQNISFLNRFSYLYHGLKPFFLEIPRVFEKKSNININSNVNVYLQYKIYTGGMGHIIRSFMMMYVYGFPYCPYLLCSTLCCTAYQMVSHFYAPELALKMTISQR